MGDRKQPNEPPTQQGIDVGTERFERDTRNLALPADQVVHIEGSAIVLGYEYKDRLLGFVGIATAISLYLHGCCRVTLEALDGFEVKIHTFDEPQLTGIRAEDPGGDRPLPSRKS